MTDSHSSALGALRLPVFRTLWIATLVSNIGTWMHQVGAAWLMTSLAPEPFMVSLIQTSASVPVLLLALPGGALADILDRRRVILAAQAWMLLSAALLGVCTLVGWSSPWLLLGFTFALGLGTAIGAPAQQAIVQELVPRSELQSAVAISGAGINLARSVGPAIGGLVVTAGGPGAVFLLNAASFVGVLVAIGRWRRHPPLRTDPPETLVGAMKGGLRYARHAPALIGVLVRVTVFIVSASALWALLPLLARDQLGLGSLGYGVLLGSLGIGAVLGTFVLARVRARWSSDAVCAGATVLLAVVVAVLAVARVPAVAVLAMFFGGISWIALMATFNVAIQIVVPGWIRARALALYNLVLMGGLALGAALWGVLGNRVDVPTALLAAAATLIAGLLAVLRYPLSSDRVDLDPSLHWPEPVLTTGTPDGDAPIIVSIEYRIDPGQAAAFVAVARELRTIRLRDGAVTWSLTERGAGVYIEIFEVESWDEHLRQHHRFTKADRQVEDRVRAFHIANEPPVVIHELRPREPDPAA